MILELTNTYKGYCHQCDNPDNIGEFCLRKQDNRFNLCEVCIADLLKKVRNGFLLVKTDDKQPAAF